MDKLREEVIQQISSKTNIPEKEVKRIVYSQFEYVLHRCSMYMETKLRYFGTFTVKKSKVEEALKIINKDETGITEHNNGSI